VDYHFISKAAFENGIARNQWAEWAEVHGNYYGTSAEFIDGGLADGRDILLDIDVQGTCRILKRYPDAITFFIMPPSLEALRRRLENRGTDSPEVIDLRLENAKQEMSCKELYRHVIVNDQLSDAVAELIGIIERYRS
jgi:guanylate kinase